MTEKEKEEKIIEWLKSFKCLSEFDRKHSGISAGMKKYNPKILKKAFDAFLSTKTSEESMQEILEFASDLNNKRPNVETKMGKKIRRFTTKNNKYYNFEFTEKLKKLRPDWFLLKLSNEILKQKSYEELLKLMPSSVFFQIDQEWKGILFKYKFICSEYGEFECRADRLLGKKSPWKKGLSGHPYMGNQIAGKKKTIIDQNNNIYESIKDAAKKLNICESTICNVLRGKQKQTKNYTFKYLDNNNDCNA